MRIMAGDGGGPALQVNALMRDLDNGLFEQRLYTDEVPPGTDARPIPGAGRRTCDLRTLGQLTAAMREFRPDIVHTHAARAGMLGRIAATLARVPRRVHTFHGHLVHGYLSPATTALVPRAERALARRTDRLLAVSQRMRDA